MSVRRLALLLSILAVLAWSFAVARAQDAAGGTPDPNKPVWAYAVSPGPPPGARGRRGGRPGGPRGRGRAADPTRHTLAGSKYSFTLSQVRNAFDPADWFPEDHPTMPDVVAHGRAPNARACAFCHMPNGKGRPENAPVAGLPKDYILRQLHEFASGARDTAEPRKPKDMLQISQNISEQDMEDAAGYFSSMPWTQWIRVVETDTVPTTRIAGQMFHLLDDGTTEPIGERIVEAPENEADEQLRAPRTGFVAYVPMGAIERGEAIVTTGGGKTIPCITCHGQNLEGIATIPGLANRSPSYLGRQIYDFKSGARHGSWSALMKPVVENLTNADIVDILAYTASRKP